MFHRNVKWSHFPILFSFIYFTVISFLQAPFETPYVVRLHNVAVIAPPQPCFIFSHPNRGLWTVSNYLRFGETSNKNVQLVLQHGCETSWNALLRVLPPMFKPVLRQIRLLQLPRTQSSLSRWKCARKGRREGYPSHGPLRFITSHSCFALASTMRKTKRLRRRLLLQVMKNCCRK